MNPSFRLGRLAGIPIAVNWSVVIIAALLCWTLAGVVLPELSPDSPTAGYWVAGVLASGAFFASLLLHELSHALVARRYGVTAESITLWLLGGVSQFGEEAPTAEAEFRISLAGPLASIGLAAGFGLLGAFASAVSLPELVPDSLVWLSFINLLLALFNLLPAYPLDGGRVFRSYMWMRTDRVKATEIAAQLGSVMAWMLIGIGVVVAFGGFIVSGVWLMLLGWFIDAMGRAEAKTVVQMDVLGSTTVGELMTAKPVTVESDCSVGELIHEYVLGTHHSAFPVIDDEGELVGLVGLEQIREVSSAKRDETTVGDIAMRAGEVPLMTRDTTGSEALKWMTRFGARRALVLDDEQHLVGILSATDLAQRLDEQSLLSDS